MNRGKPRQEPENGAPGTDGGRFTKREAVRRALGELGNDAKPGEIQNYLKDKFALEMAPNMVSSYKSSLLKKAPGRKKKRGGKVAATSPRTIPAGPTDGISLKDIQTIKDLANRLGVSKFRTLFALLYP